MDGSPPDSSVHGIFQARILEWVAISFSRGPPDPGIRPTSPESPSLADGFSTTEPRGKPLHSISLPSGCFSDSLPWRQTGFHHNGHVLASGTCILQKESSTSARSLTGASWLVGANEHGISPTHLYAFEGSFVHF